MASGTANQQILFDRVIAAFKADGAAGAIALIEANDDRSQAGAVFSELSKWLYRAQKDIEGMLAVGEAGVAFCLREAAHADQSEAVKLKYQAKVIAFNVAANCWPGWGDEGISLQQKHMQIGMKLAVVSRDLVRELRLGARETGTADWLMGALELAVGNASGALQFFLQAELAYSKGELESHRLMTRGYAALARQSLGQARAADEFSSILAELMDNGLKEATFFANQLVVAKQTLLTR